MILSITPPDEGAVPTGKMSFIGAQGWWIPITDEYYNDCKYRNLSPNSISNYKRYLKYFFDWLRKEYPDVNSLELIHGTHVKKYINVLQDKETKISTINSYVTVIKMFFNWCSEYESDEMDSRGQYKVLLEVNPLVKLKKLKAPKTLTTFLSEREVEILLDHCDERNFYGRRIKISLLLLISTGMRRFECTNIKIQDIDFNTHQIRIMGKGIKERIVPIVPGIRNQFYKYIDTRNKIMVRNKQDHDCLWVSIKGTGNVGQHTLYRDIETIAAKSGLHLTRLVHKFRNTFAAWETIKGTADYKIMQVGGWSDNSMLLHYREGLFDYSDHKNNFAQTEGPDGFYPSQVLYNKNKCTEHTHSRKDRFCSQCGKPC